MADPATPLPASSMSSQARPRLQPWTTRSLAGLHDEAGEAGYMARRHDERSRNSPVRGSPPTTAAGEGDEGEEGSRFPDADLPAAYTDTV